MEFLSNDYEKLNAYMGDDQFRQMARGFVGGHPSATPNARWFGTKLPEFLAQIRAIPGLCLSSATSPTLSAR